MGCGAPTLPAVLECSYNRCELTVNNLTNEVIKAYPLKGNQILVCSTRNLKILDTKLEKDIITSNFDEQLFSLILINNPDYKLVQGTLRGPIIVKNLNTKETQIFKGHLSTITTLNMLKNGRLISSDADGRIIIWDTKKGKKVESFFAFHSTIWNVCELNNKKIVITGDKNRSKVFNLKNKEQDRCELLFNTPNCKCLAQLTDGRIIYNNKNNLVIYTFYKIPDVSEDIEQIRKKGYHEPDKIIDSAHESDISYILPLKTGEVITGAEDGVIRVWHVKYDFACTVELAGHKNRINYIAEFPRNRLVTCSDDKRVKIWGCNQELINTEMFI